MAFQVTGKALVLGYDYNFRITSDEAIFTPGSLIVAQIRATIDGPNLITIGNGSGHITVVSDKIIDVNIPGTLSKDWQPGTVMMDFVRIDTTPDVYLGLKLTFYTEKPVTRDL